MNKSKLLIALGMAAALFCTACTSVESPVPAPTPTPGEYTGTTDINVNGAAPVGKVGSTVKTIFQETDNRGMTHNVDEITRKPGYRSVVHYMTVATTSCIKQGQATMKLDDSTLDIYKTGECFIMPAGIKGYIANNGKSVLKLNDYSVAPAGEEIMIAIEK